MQYILTTQNETRDLCVKEMKDIEPSIKIVKWVGVEPAGNAALFETKEEFSKDIINKLKATIFLRHIFRVDAVLSFDENFENALFEQINGMLASVNPQKEICVQIRQPEKNTLNIEKKALVEKIIKLFEEKGLKINFDNPKNILSIFLGSKEAYVGIGNFYENLNAYNGGMVVFNKNFEADKTISRAGNKLKEAAIVFGVNLENFKNALDLGAAPGGFTKILAENGTKVVAVDPAELDKSLAKNKNIKHQKITAEEYLKQAKNDVGRFDLILNDMKMEVEESCKMACLLANTLSIKNGLFIMTFKLPKTKQTGKIINGLRILEEKYEILAKKQLFNNRSEITVTMKRK